MRSLLHSKDLGRVNRQVIPEDLCIVQGQNPPHSAGGDEDRRTSAGQARVVAVPEGRFPT